MAIISGLETNQVIQGGTTWGTAVAAGSGDKLVGELTISDNTQPLFTKEIGSGLLMPTSATKGAVNPTASFNGDLQYRNGAAYILATFFGTETVSSEITGGQGDYSHTLTYLATPVKFMTLARETSSTTVEEIPTALVSAITISTPSIPGYVNLQAEFVGSNIDLATSTNTNAVCAAATLGGGVSDYVTVDYLDDFWIDTQASGSLASGDQFNIISYTLNLNRPLATPGEIRNTTYLGQPISSGALNGTLTVVAKQLTDHTYHTAWSAETVYKSKMTFTGAIIGSTTYRECSIYLPGMQLLKKPVYDPVSPGVNAVTMEFALIGATANPTGMSSKYPYIYLATDTATSFYS